MHSLQKLFEKQILWQTSILGIKGKEREGVISIQYSTATQAHTQTFVNLDQFKFIIRQSRKIIKT